ncbi:MAG: hypothetical protein HY773_00090 [Candidatus Terrybacteria bacterium]|nr:hypothetical protein [Candidatus Terrybacteria bacterium]
MNNKMLNNHLYNLLLQMTEEHKSLWRIKKSYLKDAGKCKECIAFWEKMTADKERHISSLHKLIKKHI